MNQSSNETYWFCFFAPLPFSSLFLLLGWEEILLRLEFIILDSFSAWGHWFGIVDSRPLSSTVGINGSYRRKQMPQFFIKACSQWCSDERQLHSIIGADSMKIGWQAGDKMEIRPGKKNWWWGSQFLRGNKPHGTPALCTHIHLYTLILNSDRLSKDNSILHRWFLQPSCYIASAQTDSLKHLRTETELLILSKREECCFFDTTYISETLTKGRSGLGRKRQIGRDTTFSKSFQVADLWSCCYTLHTHTDKTLVKRTHYLTF